MATVFRSQLKPKRASINGLSGSVLRTAGMSSVTYTIRSPPFLSERSRRKSEYPGMWSSECFAVSFGKVTGSLDVYKANRSVQGGLAQLSSECVEQTLNRTSHTSRPARHAQDTVAQAGRLHAPVTAAKSHCWKNNANVSRYEPPPLVSRPSAFVV